MFEFNAAFVLHTVLRLIYAAVAGIILGLPFRLRPGGVRTHALVTVGTTLFCVIGTGLTARYASGDVSRVVQGIIQGIGFIGAATVIKQGRFIVGVNTAASILVAAAVGCLIGLGNPLTGMIMAAFVFAVNGALKIAEEWAKSSRELHGEDTEER